MNRFFHILPRCDCNRIDKEAYESSQYLLLRQLKAIIELIKLYQIFIRSKIKATRSVTVSNLRSKLLIFRLMAKLWHPSNLLLLKLRSPFLNPINNGVETCIVSIECFRLSSADVDEMSVSEGISAERYLAKADSASIGSRLNYTKQL